MKKMQYDRKMCEERLVIMNYGTAFLATFVCSVMSSLPFEESRIYQYLWKNKNKANKNTKQNQNHQNKNKDQKTKKKPTKQNKKSPQKPQNNNTKPR